ncbi:MAG: hypothetical protein WBP02_03035 [Gammaproteobacteria bacterium]
MYKIRSLSLFIGLFAVASAVIAATAPASAQDASGPILFTNVNVFDGVNEALI